VTFLLIDFKGGAAFAPLAGVPHVVGIVSDLDVRRSRRAIESLRAELRRRELLLAERGARSIEELRGELARLVIVVDEFAAVVSGQPELHDVFSDLAARGRSLGLHLVLCTQRPSGVIRDGVLANVTLRISLRVTDRGDSTAMLGSDAAFALPPAPRGRAVIADGSGAVREVQLALAEPGDAERLRVEPESSSQETPPSPMRVNSRPARVWCDPLPELLRLEELRHDPEWGLARGIPFGRLDLPADQRQPLAVYNPAVDGHLLVLGAARGGRTTALTTFAADPHCRVLPSEPADAWSALDELSSRPIGAGETVVLLIDDLDVLIDRFDPDARHDVVDRLTRLARESRQLRIIASAQRLTGPLQRLAGLFDARLLLRQPSRDEHVLAGGDGTSFDPRLPPGAGTWLGGASSAASVQVAVCDRPLPVAGLPELPRVRLEQGTPLAIVAGRPRELLLRVAGAEGGIRVIRVGEEPTPEDAELRVTRSEPTLLLGDPDAWQAEWALLSSVRREFPIVFFGCTPAEVRAIARIRETPPPLGDRPGECWLVDGGGIRRAILEL
jgi:S-DNA-T family DNA segregation ATPase FtsK/SpoIIIE